ncbi:bifunctional DNA-binding transcriptional regulator/O6-methylguanine-DNA methyltransferase Ada [Tianweitania sediminis]|uniref:Regulatory protein of adaptive response n=1 Tax=Tianweitania sediminis TaxID=1502156 RepID=A0A8J7UJJ5_9HYPH|nr:bifunctional DNA-binding transcriptional regulator/O6-methylguanine-DNA methyltransferase Ada [Tianweitania sediminis]MBP0438734.1 bifunctional DNA-binding transcriptional regulator/O6-methylguanine-DNA methyltransferase Ada [Tianweitania sediminis]HEV7414910.1 bifunctional DNA-binding transcriptional regulator/O6-methylguanine-DNA methyltransferase Ada [Tianweitania sediminis]
MSVPLQSISDDPRWHSVVSRDARADNRFVYAVTTTGVYCRPSCPSRRAKPENIRFFASAAEAKQAQFRPCLRCKPDGRSPREQRLEVIEAACRSMEQATEPPSLESLARAAGLSPFYFHRAFKEATGMTPRAFAAAQRAERVRAALASSEHTVAAALYDAGFNASSRFYAQSDAVLGMAPKAYKKGGASQQIRFAVGACCLGQILVAQSDKGICAILLGDDPHALLRNLQDRFPQAELLGGDPSFEHTVAQVVALVDEPRGSLDLPLDIRGTAFQQRVWQALREIPAGETISYSELAQRLGAPRAVRAVASACAANALAVVVPCHRVVRSDGGLSGYRWGLERKQALITKEALRLDDQRPHDPRAS